MLRLLRQLLDVIYGLYALVAFVMLSLTALVLVTLVPGLSLTARRAIAHWFAHAFFVVSGIRVAVLDKQLLPQGPCVVVANHASYIDGVLLKAYLPARFCFVIKKEVTRVPLAGLLLRRIGSEFVDRFNRNAGAVDARRLIKAADAGQALAFFPEGTFNAEPGVGKFHTGAFAIAARAGLPVVPVAIRGSRYILPSTRLLPRFGHIDIQILPPIANGQGNGPGNSHTHTSMHTVREQARLGIIRALGEPDLSDIDGVAALQARRS